jgi:hypothetical protein
MKYDWENPKRVNHSSNWILNKIGNLCELMARPLMSLYYRWGTFWSIGELNFTEDIDAQLEEE